MLCASPGSASAALSGRGPQYAYKSASCNSALVGMVCGGVENGETGDFFRVGRRVAVFRLLRTLHTFQGGPHPAQQLHTFPRDGLKALNRVWGLSYRSDVAILVVDGTPSPAPITPTLPSLADPTPP